MYYDASAVGYAIKDYVLENTSYCVLDLLGLTPAANDENSY